jgi:hypothetical protein
VVKGVKMEMKKENFQTCPVTLPPAPDNRSTIWGMWTLGMHGSLPNKAYVCRPKKKKKN